ncbi:DinB family protein [Rhodococcus sp. KRD197]|uniref:DinB family protein n=1 Tax=Rhodococcus sp. KRD197 TaxID=2729731 RepID=UPI0027DA8282|nr:DinB family protein [Rhodococcus sp. KRD197]
MTVATTRLDLLRWQFDLTWALFELHLEELTSEMLRWEPARVCWNVRIDEHRQWTADWDEAELDPIPVPTIGWLTWHIGWWWTVALDHAQGKTPRERIEIVWPGDLDGVLAWLRDLRLDWLEILAGYADCDLDAPSSYPWGKGSENTVAHTVAWLNAELMKNTAEIGQLRLQCSAS